MIEDSKDKLGKADVKLEEPGGLMLLVGPMARSIF